MFYIYSQYGAKELETLRSLGVTRVINVNLSFLGTLETFKKKQYLEKAFDFVEEMQNSGISVPANSQARVSRSAMIAVAYNIKNKLFTIVEAYNFVRITWPIVSSNLDSIGQLLELELRATAGK